MKIIRQDKITAMTRSEKRTIRSDNIMRIAAMLITLVGFSVRLHHLAGDSFWYDEILTVNIAGGNLGEAFSVRSHPPLFYLLVSSAIKLLEENEFAARLPSAIAGALAVPLLLVWGRLMKRPRAGLWAGLLLALSPFHVRYSQEARHYAWLMLLSLATYIFLYLAIHKTRWRWWVIFALLTALNIYTHYGALVVLASQTIFLSGWIIWQWFRRQRRAIIYPLTSAIIVISLLLVWLPKLQLALRWNLGETAVRGSQDIMPATVWAREMFYAFGTTSPWLPYALMGLFCAGLLIWAQERRWIRLTLIGSGVLLPIILISSFQVSRWAFAKYVIYILPLFLLTIGVALDTILQQSKRLLGEADRPLYVVSSVSILAFFLLTARPLLQEEHQSMRRDWRGVANYLDETASAGDVVLIMTLDLGSGFNQGAFVLPYYLSQTSKQYHVLVAHNLDEAKLDRLLAVDTEVWVTFINRVTDIAPEAFSPPLLSFQGSLFLWDNSTPPAPILDQIIHIYRRLLPLAISPSPHCLLQEDLALLYTKAKEYVAANDIYAQAKGQCRQQVNGRFSGEYDLVREIYHGLIVHYEQNGKIQEARRVAAQLLAINRKDDKALETLTVANLLRAFEAGEGQISAAGEGIEPVQVRRYTMPHNGDWGNVLMIHPPQSWSYQMTLPLEPTRFYSRVAMAPESWAWNGDGSTFVVTINTVTEPPKTVFRQYVSNTPPDQVWHEVSVPLTLYAGQSITLTLQTAPGPAGDFSGDWAGWETPRILYASPAPDLND